MNIQGLRSDGVYSPGRIKGWWDYTSFIRDNPEVKKWVERLSCDDLVALSRDGFTVRMYDDPQSFFYAEAMEYIETWRLSTSDNPTMICGPVGPVEQLPLVASIINDLQIDVHNGLFAGMDELYDDDQAVPYEHPLSFKRIDMEWCFDRIDPGLVMPDENLYFPTNIGEYVKPWNDPGVRRRRVQGGQGWTKHIAFDDPLKAEGKYADRPPTPEEFAALSTRVVDLHPVTIMQDAYHSNGGDMSEIPSQAVTVGMREILSAEEVSIWHPGHHDGPFGVRLTALMISQGWVDARVPMSLLGLLDGEVVFSYLRPKIGPAGVDPH